MLYWGGCQSCQGAGMTGALAVDFGSVAQLMGDYAPKRPSEDFVGSPVIGGIEHGLDRLADAVALYLAERKHVSVSGKCPGQRAALVEKGGEGVHLTASRHSEHHQIVELLGGRIGLRNKTHSQSGLLGNSFRLCFHGLPGLRRERLTGAHDDGDLWIGISVSGVERTEG